MTQEQAREIDRQKAEIATNLKISLAIKPLQERLLKLEEHLGLEWSQSNGKYYMVAPIDNKGEDVNE